MACQRCARPVPPQSGPGRPRKWCSPNCRKAAARNRRRGECIGCGGPLGQGSAWPRAYAEPWTRCRSCHRAHLRAAHDATVKRVAELYNAGLTYRQIARELGWGERSIPGAEVREARARGLVGYRNQKAKHHPTNDLAWDLTCLTANDRNSGPPTRSAT